MAEKESKRNTAFLIGRKAAVLTSSLGMAEMWSHRVLVPELQPSASLPFLVGNQD